MVHGTWYIVHGAWCMVHEIIAVCGVGGYVPTVPSFPLKAEWLAAVPVFNSESLDNSRCFFEFILYIVYCILYI